MENYLNNSKLSGKSFLILLLLAATSSMVSIQSARADAISQDRLEKQKRYLEMRERERAEKKKEKQQSDANKAAKKRNCERARITLNEYKTATALYDYDKNGKKVYLDKQKRRDAEKSAAKDVKKWCR